MQVQLFRYNEQLDTEELAFLVKKEARDKTMMYKLIRVLMVFCFVIPFIATWFRATDGVPDPFSYTYYFSGVLFLACFSGFAVFVSYRRTLYKIEQDIRHRTKTIERTHITRKQFMPQNNTYYFYLNSPNKLSIEVKQEDFHAMQNGDELNIEYTTYSKFYLGYF